MGSGGPGDHPVTDIVSYPLPVYSPAADALIRDIAQLVPTYRLHELMDGWSPPPIDEFTAKLRSLRDELRRNAQARGWEV